MSSSTISALYITRKLSDNHYQIKYNEHAKSYPRFKWIENLENIENFICVDQLIKFDANNLLQKLCEDYKYFPYYFIKLFTKFNNVDNINQIIEKATELMSAMLPPSKKETIKEHVFIRWMQIYSLCKERNVLNALYKHITKKWNCLNKEKRFPKLGKLIKETIREKLVNEEFSKITKEEVELVLEKRNFVQASLFLIETINKIVENYSGECAYVNLTYFNLFFNNHDLNGPTYWAFTKKKMSWIFDNIFDHQPTLLYWRFMRMLHNSRTRIDFIKSMQYIKMKMVDLADMHEMRLTQNDLIMFSLIIQSSNNLNDDKFIEHTDTLIMTRMLVKHLWQYGSLSTQSFTNHTHEHGDSLLKNYNIFRREREIRTWLTKEDIDIYPLIASFYLHDLGMLLNRKSDEVFNGTIFNIYEKISSNVRKEHGVKSSEIIMTRLGHLLGMDPDWINSIALGSIAHQSGTDNLSFENNRILSNALILSIMDLFDITYERSSLLARFLTGSMAGKTTKQHWYKHYIAKTLSYEFDFYDKENIKITLTIQLNKNITDSEYFNTPLSESNKTFNKSVQEFIKSNGAFGSSIEKFGKSVQQFSRLSRLFENRVEQDGKLIKEFTKFKEEPNGAIEKFGKSIQESAKLNGIIGEVIERFIKQDIENWEQKLMQKLYDIKSETNRGRKIQLNIKFDKTTAWVENMQLEFYNDNNHNKDKNFKVFDNN